MKRYYLSPIVGTGTREDTFRALIADLGVNHVAVIPTDAAGKPTSTWALCLVAAINHLTLLADSRIGALPSFPLDARMSAMGVDAKVLSEQSLDKFGISRSVLDPSSKAYREVIRDIGKILEPTFDENNFDVSE